MVAKKKVAKKKVAKKKVAKKKAPQMVDGINPQRELFCQAYSTKPNATKAAIKAGYSKKTAKSQGQRLLTYVDVKTRIDVLTAKSVGKLEVVRDNVVREMNRISMFDVRKLYDESGNLKPIHELDDDTAAAVSGLEVVSAVLGKGKLAIPVHTHKIKTNSKNAALDMLGKHFNIYEDHQKSGQGNVTINIEGKDAQA